LTDASDIVIRSSRAASGTEVFLQLEGKNSRAVRLESCDLSAAKQKFVTGPGVGAEVVAVK
jgi:hypothetical protein